MEILYKSTCLSIVNFEPVTLPDFTVLTGLNGTGKSQLFTAIKFGHVEIDNIPKENIVSFDNSLFGLDNEPAITLQVIQNDRTNAFKSIKEVLPDYVLNNLQTSIDAIIEIANLNDLSFYELTPIMF